MTAKRTMAGLVLAVLGGVALAAAGEPQAGGVEELRAVTVRITVEHGVGEVELGAGIILCQAGGRVDVLTAKHVLTGIGLTDDSGQPLGERFRDVRQIEIAFYRNAPLPMRLSPEAPELVIQKSESKDLALITLGSVETPLVTARLGFSGALRTRDPVESIGHLSAARGDWLWTDGKVRKVDDLIDHSSDVGGGYSGGPLFNAAGEVVGVNLQTVAGVARAVTIEEALQAVAPWLDPECWRRGVGVGDPAAAADVAAAGAVETFVDCPGCPEMVVVPAGRFTMGSPAGEAGRHWEEGPQHEVRIDRPFALGKLEVTRAQFAEFVRDAGYASGSCLIRNPRRSEWDRSRSWWDPAFQQADDEPVVCVSWQDAQAYAAWLSRKSGREYRLPSEAEWEYAARAGTALSWPWGAADPCAHANVADQELREAYPKWRSSTPCRDGHVRTAPVGSFPHNAFGAHDLAGNVGEWVEDCWNAGYAGAPADGSPWRGGNCDHRVVRGGAWSSHPGEARSARRHHLGSAMRINDLGFRVARTLP